MLTANRVQLTAYFQGKNFIVRKLTLCEEKYRNSTSLKHKFNSNVPGRHWHDAFCKDLIGLFLFSLRIFVPNIYKVFIWVYTKFCYCLQNVTLCIRLPMMLVPRVLSIHVSLILDTYDDRFQFQFRKHIIGLQDTISANEFENLAFHDSSLLRRMQDVA